MTTSLSTKAREAVLDQYARAFEEHAVEEQLTRTTDPGTAWEHHEAGLVALRARMDEENPRKPIEAPLMHCLECAFYYRRSAS